MGILALQLHFCRDTEAATVFICIRPRLLLPTLNALFDNILKMLLILKL